MCDASHEGAADDEAVHMPLLLRCCNDEDDENVDVGEVEDEEDDESTHPSPRRSGDAATAPSAAA